MNKAEIYNLRAVNIVLNELKLLTEMKHPFIVNMNYAFQEIDNVYLV